MKRELTHDSEKTAARRLLGATRLTESEIDKIAAAPHLFGSIRTRIAEERLAAETFESPKAGWFGVKAIAAAAVMVTVMSAAAFVVLRDNSPLKASVPAPAVQQAQPATTQRFDEPRRQEQATVVRHQEPDREVGHQVTPPTENAIMKEYIRRVQAARKGAKPSARPRTEEMDFYALNASAWETRDGRIVRVTLPRASLVALGANISLEGDRQNVTADLLVGADGVPRAIRVLE